ncbi:hypothetical protein A4X06_0g6973 [Tilletia controversa]|uniref:Uncharacterized protein n=1 Tax=Tilletia controversa TaxID=13291 RepID=A0A8X7MN14_9BASI|nr:hypothetical protein A4X06_0g6973 [Tilletia controversa]
MRGLGRFVEAVVVAGTATIDEPPAFLFDKEDAARGRGGPRPGSDSTPTPKHTSSSSTRTHSMSAKARQLATTGSPTPTSFASSSSRRILNRALKMPLQEGPRLCTIRQLSAQLGIVEETVKILHKGGYYRISQLASAYTYNFEALSEELSMSASLLSTIEDLLSQWPTAESRDEPNPFNFGPVSDEDVFGPVIGDSSFKAKQETKVKQETIDTTFSEGSHGNPDRRPLVPRSPIQMRVEDAIVFSSSQ